MKVKELIAKISNFNQEADIRLVSFMSEDNPLSIPLYKEKIVAIDDYVFIGLTGTHKSFIAGELERRLNMSSGFILGNTSSKNPEKESFLLASGLAKYTLEFTIPEIDINVPI